MIHVLVVAAKSIKNAAVNNVNMRMLWILLSICCFLYYGALIFYVGFNGSFSTVWLIMGIVFLLIWRMSIIGFHPFAALPTWCKTIFLILLIGGFLFFVFIEGCIISHMGDKGPKDLSYLIVLGAQVKGETPSRSLITRLEQAYRYLQQNENTIAVLSGGKGSGEDISEASAMQAYLMKRGIPAERLLLEKDSVNTEQNLRFSMSLMGTATEKTGIVTSRYHVFRAILLGKKAGFTNLYGIAAMPEPLLEPNFMLREFFAVVKDFLVNNI